jgi:hypothetical protein
MGARLVAASLPIYALAVAIVVYENWQTRTTGIQSYYWWGLAVEVAIVTLIVGGYSTGVFGRPLAVAALVYLFLVLVPYVAVIAPAVWPFVILLYWVFSWFAWFVDGAFLLLYLERYRALWRRSSAVASASLSTATPLTVAVLLTPIVVGPHYWPEWRLHETGTTVLVATTAVAGASAIALLAGLRWPRVPLRVVPIAFGAVAILEAAMFVRGLPNVPMKTAGAPPFTLEYPADRADLGVEADAFRATVVSVVRRSGVTLPAQGVYARYRWHNGGPWNDPAPPSGVTVVTLWAEIMDKPEERRQQFGRYMATAVIPANDGRVPETNHPHWGYLNWALTSDADAEPMFRKVCEQLTTNKFLGIVDFDFAPYLRAEHDGGLAAARALHARWMTSPPGYNEWSKVIRDSCAPPL